MSIASMTGFARSQGHEGDFGWRWEVRSVNARGLDVRCRMPPGLEAFELVARAAVAERFERGGFNLSLAVSRSPGEVKLVLNREMLDQLLGVVRDLEGEVDAAPPRLDGLLRVRGVLEETEEEEAETTRTRREAVMAESLNEALVAVAAMRRGEGERLAGIVEGHLERIGERCSKAASLAAAQPEAMKARLKEQVSALLEELPAVPEDRLAQEAALLISKADVREEIDRIESHIAAARELIAQGGPVGRRLDFLAQEFNREANTLCSKSVDIELTRVGLELKAVIEQFREQIRNIE
ncbi:MAG: YicC/YloC family endoribonuclease [Alphaproteobacteria bacterium]